MNTFYSRSVHARVHSSPEIATSAAWSWPSSKVIWPWPRSKLTWPWPRSKVTGHYHRILRFWTISILGHNTLDCIILPPAQCDLDLGHRTWSLYFLILNTFYSRSLNARVGRLGDVHRGESKNVFFQNLLFHGDSTVVTHILLCYVGPPICRVHTLKISFHSVRAARL